MQGNAVCWKRHGCHTHPLTATVVHLHKTSTRSSQSTSQHGYGKGLTNSTLAEAVLALERLLGGVIFR